MWILNEIKGMIRTGYLLKLTRVKTFYNGGGIDIVTPTQYAGQVGVEVI